eukprot:PhM_4_TR1379/c0_g1_i1/m.40387
MGTPCTLHVLMIFFCTRNMQSTGSTTPRLDRHTSTPSLWRTTASSSFSPLTLSILEKTSAFSGSTSRTALISLTDRTPLTKMKSMPSSGTNVCKSSASSVDRIGRAVREVSSTPTRRTTLLLDKRPGYATEHTTSVSLWTISTTSCIFPSSMTIVVPGCAIVAKFGYRTYTRDLMLPESFTDSSVVRTRRSPWLSWASAPVSTTTPVRGMYPRVSKATATCCPHVFAAARTFCTSVRTSSRLVMCGRLMRATCMPFWINCSMAVTVLDDGPSVHTTRVMCGSPLGGSWYTLNAAARASGLC